MSSYHGGKQRIGKKIAQVIYDESIDIENEYEFKIKGYCEPFCGMLGVYQHIPDLFTKHVPILKYKAGDTNKSLIKLWKELQKGNWIPKDQCSKQCFERLKNDGEITAYKGYVGHLYSFRGIYFSSYTKRTKSRFDNSANKLKKIASQLKNVQFNPGMYTQYSNLKGYVIYCDPPYEKQSWYYTDTGKKREALKFDHNKFWAWCRKMSTDNIVFVSEYKAPKDFEQTVKIGNEKLFLMF